MRKIPKYKIASRNFRTFVVIVIIILSCITFLFFLLWQSEMYFHDQAIKQGAKSTVTALEMTVACQSISNVTSEQIFDEYIKIFIKPKINQTLEDRN